MASSTKRDVRGSADGVDEVAMASVRPPGVLVSPNARRLAPLMDLSVSESDMAALESVRYNSLASAINGSAGRLPSRASVVDDGSADGRTGRGRSSFGG